MIIVQHSEHFRIEKPCILTIGTFDGVHLGHQKILAKLQDLKNEKKLNAVVLTFDPHPRKILFPEQKDLKLLTLTAEKLELFDKYKVDVAVLYPFNTQFSNLTPENYVEEVLVKKLNVKYLVIGYDHKFGASRNGDIQTLKTFSKNNNFFIEEISAQDIDHIAVSSTRIRRALEEGNIKLANSYLGHSYFINATVVKGKQLGRVLGYATANLEIPDSDKLIPKTGVYFVSVNFQDKKYFGMLSVGTNPTTDEDNQIKTEVHIFDFNEDIYSKEIKVSFLQRLRDEIKFPGLNELKLALDKDKEMCLDLIDKY